MASLRVVAVLAVVIIVGGRCTAAVPFDVTGASARQCAVLLRGLDHAAAAGDDGAAAAVLRRYAEDWRRQLGRTLLARLHGLLADDVDGAAVAELVATRDAVILSSRRSALFQAVVVPEELRTPATGAVASFWSGPASSSSRTALARALGGSADEVTAGPDLAARIRRRLLDYLIDGYTARAGRLRQVLREAAHEVRAATWAARIATAASTTIDGSDWPLARTDGRLDELILGALVYLDDTQVRDRVGKLSAAVDASEVGEGSTSKFVFDSAFTMRDLELPLLFDATVHSSEGQWASFIHFAPHLWQKVTLSGRAKVAILQDTNLFTTAFVLHPLLMVDDDTGVVNDMIDRGMAFIETCRRGPAYAFWPRLPQDVCPYDVIGPPNTPYGPVQWMGRMLVSPAGRVLLRRLTAGHSHLSFDAFVQFMDPAVNPAGAAAIVNIPPDADDTAVAVAARVLWARRRGEGAVDTAALDAMATFRDLDRQKEEGADAWKGKDSGGYLTWIRDENEPVLSSAELGSIPMEVNNVDGVVQANALYGATLAGRTDLPGLDDCRALVERVAAERLWPGASMYYPQLMMFPYCASRAYRDAGARAGSMRAAMGRLLVDVLDLQLADGTWKLLPPRRVGGAFRGDPDRTYDLSTALACTCLMNLGEALAAENGVLERYRRALHDGMRFLMGQARAYDVRDRGTFGYSATRPRAYVWAEGLFFSSGPGAMAYWRSEPYTVAMVLETLVKYRLGYDRHDGLLAWSPRLKLVPPRTDLAMWSVVPTDRGPVGQIAR